MCYFKDADIRFFSMGWVGGFFSWIFGCLVGVILLGRLDNLCNLNIIVAGAELTAMDTNVTLALYQSIFLNFLPRKIFLMHV